MRRQNSRVGRAPKYHMVIPVTLGMERVLFVNWAIDPAVVAPHLPRSLSVDTFDGRAWLTAVALENVDVRPRGLPAAVGFDIPEVNFHTKVTCGGVPGIYYFSVDVGSILGTALPRLFYHAPYHYADVELQPVDGGQRVTCRRRHPGSRPLHFDARYGPSGGELDVEPDSLAWFLTERHRFFTETLDETVYSAAIRHEQWPLRRAEATVERNRLFRANGFGEPPEGPVSYYSHGVCAEMTRCRPWWASAHA
ncbi:YqjF family protein [Haladaptatus halobius]|uniref:YqjF family protein n=1 Tax=Haladaptatus halobius TaxID=2884875 RepID=UPI001D0A05EE|nr:DUF2071 domain-containing protein [Haladaptatus halobius]